MTDLNDALSNLLQKSRAADEAIRAMLQAAEEVSNAANSGHTFPLENVHDIGTLIEDLKLLVEDEEDAVTSDEPEEGYEVLTTLSQNFGSGVMWNLDIMSPATWTTQYTLTGQFEGIYWGGQRYNYGARNFLQTVCAPGTTWGPQVTFDSESGQFFAYADDPRYFYEMMEDLQRHLRRHGAIY